MTAPFVTFSRNSRLPELIPSGGLFEKGRDEFMLRLVFGVSGVALERKGVAPLALGEPAQLEIARPHGLPGELAEYPPVVRDPDVVYIFRVEGSQASENSGRLLVAPSVHEHHRPRPGYEVVVGKEGLGLFEERGNVLALLQQEAYKVVISLAVPGGDTVPPPAYGIYGGPPFALGPFRIAQRLARHAQPVPEECVLGEISRMPLEQGQVPPVLPGKVAVVADVVDLDDRIPYSETIVIAYLRDGRQHGLVY